MSAETKKWIVLLVLVLSVAVGCARPAPKPQPVNKPPPVDPEPNLERDYARSWPTSCGDLKRALDPAQANLKASELPRSRGPADPWMLAVGSFSISLPRDSYVIKPSLSPRSLSVVLLSPKTVILVVKDPPALPMKDVFAKAGQQQQQGSNSGAARRLTLKLFGKYPTLFDLMDIGYKHALEDLTCSSEHVDEEVPISIALVLKTTGAWAKEVYRQPFGLPGFLFSGPRGTGCVVEAQLFDSEASTIVSYTLRGANEAGCQARLRRLRMAKAALGRGPRWLSLLGEAITEQRNATKWRMLQTELKHAKSAAASIEAIDKLLAELAH